MAGAKTNERPGTRARASYVRSSPYKVRAVLDQIRGKSYVEAMEILTLSERDAAVPVRKVVESAVANAEHNDGLDAAELYVSACYADEGPTLKRWRPRARGRATRIRKRSCHITVIVSRYDEEALEALMARAEAGRGRAADRAEARRRRVARSRQAADEASGDEAADDATGDEAAADGATGKAAAADETSGGGAAGGETAAAGTTGDAAADEAVADGDAAVSEGSEDAASGAEAAGDEASGGDKASGDAAAGDASGGDKAADNETREA